MEAYLLFVLLWSAYQRLQDSISSATIASVMWTVLDFKERVLL